MFIDFGDMTPQQVYFTLTQTVIPCLGAVGKCQCQFQPGAFFLFQCDLK
jgi:hypothetical protein